MPSIGHLTRILLEIHKKTRHGKLMIENIHHLNFAQDSINSSIPVVTVKKSNITNNRLFSNLEIDVNKAT